jgi:Tol biopolymer transport system component
MRTDEPTQTWSRSALDERRDRLPAVERRDPLRAALRLIFAAEQADRLAASASPAVVPDDLRRVARAASTRYTAARLAAYLRRGQAAEPLPPLAPARAMPSAGAVMLALHLSLELDCEALADLLDTSDQRVGADLHRARQALDPQLAGACRQIAPLIGRYRDRALGEDERMELVTHARGCDACRVALARADRVDTELLAALRNLELDLGPLRPARRSTRLLRALSVAGAALLVVILLVVGLSVAGRLLVGSREPVPAVIAPRESQAGWALLNAADGGVEALNLATSEVRAIGSRSNSMETFVDVSPSGRLIASWERDPGSLTGSRMSVRQLDGTLLREKTWEDDSYRFPVGWIGEEAVLLAEQPHFMDGRQESRLIAVDLAGGAERVLYTGTLAAYQVAVSPDGSLVALYVPPTGQSDGGVSLEVRPLGPDGLGEPIARYEGNVLGLAVWARDSSRLYMALRPEVELPDGDGAKTSGSAGPRSDLVAVDRDGRSMVLVPASGDEIVYPLDVSPDGQTLIFARATIDESAEFGVTYELWRANLDGGSPERIPLGEGLLYASGVAWAADGQTMLVAVMSAFYMPSDDSPRDGVWPDAGALVIVAPGEAPRVLVSRTAVVPGLIAWLPEDALPSAAASTAYEGRASDPEAVSEVEPDAAIDAASALSPSGGFALLSSSRGQVVWSLEERWSRLLLQGTSDLSWMPDGLSMIGVQSRTTTRGTEPSRLAFFSVAGPSGTNFAFRRFDPAGIGEDRDRRYARPLVSPDGTTTAFYVVNAGRTTVELWVAGVAHEPEAVARWTAPAERVVEAPLVAAWVSPDTLLFVEPLDWRRGLPRRAALRRLTLALDGGTTVDPLIELDGRGSDRGIILTEWALSPDSSQLVYRVRHYKEYVATDSRYDTLHGVALSDLAQALELARGNPGDGLGWSPDGAWIVAGLRHQLVLLDPDGRELIQITPDNGRAAYPLWRDDEIWYASSLEGDTRIMRVQVR